MKIAVPKERAAGERRVALVPEIVAKFVKGGHTVVVEHDAGASAGYTDAAYLAAGATIAPDARAAYDGADVVARVAKPSDEELDGIKRGTALIGFLAPLGDPHWMFVFNFVALPVAIAVSALITYGFEQPILRLGRRRRDLRPTAMPIAAETVAEG